DLGEKFLSLDQRRTGQIPAATVGKVEQIEDQRLFGPQFESILQLLKVGDSPVAQVNHLAIEYPFGEGQFLEGCSNGTEAMSPIIALPGDQPHFSLVEHGEDAIAVELDLVQPVIARGDVSRKGRQLR